MSRVWFNGALHIGALPLDPRERGLLLGDGIFETILVLNRTPLWANMHLARMEGAAKELGLGFDRDGLDDAIATILDGIDETHHVLRITLTRGAAVRGLGANGGVPTLILLLDRFDPDLMFQPVTLATSSFRRNPWSVTSRLKTVSYIDNIAAAREAASRGLEDALMLNTEGAVACSTIANVFLLKGGMLSTPAREHGILTGVMRQALIAAAGQLDITTEERAIQPQELISADAVFLTNSLRFIRPVKSLDLQPLAMADLGHLVNALCETARLQCGRDPRLI
ncbi:aminotransferase class IV [Aestuariivirga sp.]|uniref:aminotransferase class IV n=1 Tax=Aestuariivirga sp. TaxID=2650926 RepID=UPI0035940F7B